MTKKTKVKDALEQICEYLADEKIDYEENGSPDTHVWLAVERIADYLKYVPIAMEPSWRCSKCGDLLTKWEINTDVGELCFGCFPEDEREEQFDLGAAQFEKGRVEVVEALRRRLTEEGIAFTEERLNILIENLISVRNLDEDIEDFVEYARELEEQSA